MKAQGLRWVGKGLGIGASGRGFSFKVECFGVGFSRKKGFGLFGLGFSRTLDPEPFKP